MSTFNGVGTTFYGKTKRNKETNSYIATEWFVVFFYPIMPLGSYRLRRESIGFWILPGWINEKFAVIERVKLNTKQIILTYLVFYGPFLFVALLVIFLNYGK